MAFGGGRPERGNGMVWCNENTRANQYVSAVVIVDIVAVVGVMVMAVAVVCWFVCLLWCWCGFCRL